MTGTSPAGERGLIGAEAAQEGGGIRPERGRIAVYSCHFGRYEPFHDHALGPAGNWDRIIFTDRADLDAPGRRVVLLPDGFDGLTSKQASRLPKLMPERFLARYDWVLYVDNRARLMVRPDALVARIEAAQGGEAPAGRYLARLAQRGCAWREARICLRKGFMDEAEYARVQAAFEAAGFPREAGMFMNTALVQRMGSDETARLNAAWFRAFCEVAGRDQVLLPFVLWQTGLTQHELGFGLDEVIRWPIFGRRVRRLYQRGKPLPEGWDQGDPSEGDPSEGDTSEGDTGA